jgi:hypothetical protein
MKASELVSKRKVGPVGREENDLLIKFCTFLRTLDI